MKRNKKSIEAEKLYRNGMKLVDIASKLNVPAGTVRRWKSTYKWDGEQKSERSDKKANVRKEEITERKKVVAEDVKSVIENPDLTEKQRLFCIYYVKYRNKTKAYQKAFQCSYESACSNASTLWKNSEIQREVNQLLEEYRENIELDIKDLFQWYLNIARADINDFVKVKDFGISVREQIDGTLVSEISETQNGIKVKLNDRMKAMEWLGQHIDLADEKLRAEIALLQTKAAGNSQEAELDKLDKVLAEIKGVV